MKNYNLRSDETILYRGEISLLSERKKIGELKSTKAELLLTNLYIVISFNTKSLFKTNTETKTYDVEDVKIYDDTVQVLRKKNRANVYLQGEELFFEFPREKDAKEFCDKAQKLISGNSKLVRAVKKTQKAIKETNEALDIDVANIAMGAATIAANATVAASEVTGAGKKTRMLGAVVGSILKGNKKKNNELPPAKDEKEGE